MPGIYILGHSSAESTSLTPWLALARIRHYSYLASPLVSCLSLHETILITSLILSGKVLASEFPRGPLSLKAKAKEMKRRGRERTREQS